jgi:superfamily I DNA/RNA helicase
MDSLFSYPATPAPGFPLNPEQRAAAHHGEGPLVVVAGAGTGKTRVITERIRYLLDTQPELTGKEILGLTFTDKAAAEMKHRVVAPARERGEAEAGRAEAVTLSTFHAFCNNLLLELDPDLKPIDNIDHWILLRRNLPLLQLEHYRRLAEPGQFLGDFVEFFSRCQDELVTPDNYQRYAEEQARAFERVRTAMPEDERAIRDEEIAKALEIARAYRASDLLLRERKLITFGTQILDAVQRLKADASLRERLRARYRYILVDEFQDTNIAQLELLWLLGGDRPNLVVVGDHRQAIYRFRGASFGSFTIFLKRFASGAAAGRDLLQPLTRNYRSSGRILRVAGQAIRHNEKPPNIPEYPLEAEREDGEKVRIVTHESSEAEAHWVAGELERLHGAGARWRAFAVLYRSHGHRDKLVEALKARQIPFVIKNLSILSHRLVRDVIAYLRLIDHPSEDVACARVLAMPAWGLAPADLVRLTERAAKTKGVSLWDTMLAAKDEAAFSAGDRNLPALVEMITELRKKARQLTAVELFDELAEAVQISAAVADEDRKYFDRLAQFLRDWQPKSETQRLKEFVEYLDYFEQAGGAINLEQESGDAVQLMTVHAAKGLEFDHVYVLRLVQRSFPAGERPHVLEFPPELMKEEQPQGSFHIQEERRLFYVAPHAEHRRQQALQALGVSRRHSHGPANQAPRRPTGRAARCRGRCSAGGRRADAVRYARLARARRLANRRVGDFLSPARARATDDQPFGDGHAAGLRTKISLQRRVETALPARRGHELRQRDAQHHQIFYRRAGQGAHAAFRGSGAQIPVGVDFGRIRRRLPGAGIQERRPNATARLLRADAGGAARGDRAGKSFPAADGQQRRPHRSDGSGEPARPGPGRDRRLQNRQAARRRKGAKGFAAERLRAGRARSVRLESRAAHPALPAKRSAGERHARRKAAEKSVRRHSGSCR